MPTFLQLVRRLLGLERGSPKLDHLLRIDVALLTDVGRKRAVNEDCMAAVVPENPRMLKKKGVLFIVADGLGGHAKGEVASRMTVDAVRNVYYQDGLGGDIASLLLHAVQRANEVIYHQIEVKDTTSFGAMGSTCTAAVLHDNTAYIANVGDSRAYIIRGGKADQISQDHSWVAEQVRAGKLTQEQAYGHERGSIITRCLGTHADVEVDLFVEPMQAGETLLLCSDGLSNLVSDEELAAYVQYYQPEECVTSLDSCANERGGTDNITIIVARLGPDVGAPKVTHVAPLYTHDGSYPQGDEQESEGLSGITRELRTLGDGGTTQR